jgi:hypothetical protein
MSVGGSPKFIRCSALKIGGLTGAMDQFASKWTCKELRIRYVSGPATKKSWVQPGDMGYRCTGYMGDNLGPKGLSSGSITRVSRSKYARS